MVDVANAFKDLKDNVSVMSYSEGLNVFKDMKDSVSVISCSEGLNVFKDLRGSLSVMSRCGFRCAIIWQTLDRKVKQHLKLGILLYYGMFTFGSDFPGSCGPVSSIGTSLVAMPTSRHLNGTEFIPHTCMQEH